MSSRNVIVSTLVLIVIACIGFAGVRSPEASEIAGLNWHTDLAVALDEAQRTNRPVLSLRLLGRLDEELSCANSRFFRAILYPDPQIAQLLRESYVLHWESVRDVPVMTIDFGDGRTLTRTVTGNSIHYILTPDGQVVDALPGLIAPRIFERELRMAADFIQSSPSRSAITDYQQRTLGRLPRETFAATDLALPNGTMLRISTDAKPRALEAAEVAMSKVLVERPLLRLATNPMPALADDTRLNMTVLRPQILQWLTSGQNVDLKSLNDRIYRELFLTPLDDPWMGLDVPDVFSGLPSVR